MPIQLHISPRLVTSVATLYTDVTRILMEYIDNSFDSAEDDYDNSKKCYRRPIEIIIVITGKNHTEGKIIIIDNCTGIKNLPKVVNSIGDSEKKEQPWTNGQFGYGIYSFMACCSQIEITTKIINEQPQYIPIHKDKFNTAKQEDVIFPDPERKITLTSNNENKLLQQSGHQAVNYESGTKIVLSNFEKDKWKEIDVDKLKDEIEKHFELLLSRENLKVKIIIPNKIIECRPFNYDLYPGEIYQDDIKELSTNYYHQKHIMSCNPPIKIFIKVTKGQEINKRPVFISKGRRISEVKDVRSFRSCNKSRLWDHPNVTGYIDLSNFLGPTIARTDFRSDKKSKAFFEYLKNLEPLLIDIVNEANEEAKDRHYRGLEDRLNKALAELAKKDQMRFQSEYILGGSINLETGSNGSVLQEGMGGDRDFSKGEGHIVHGPIGVTEGEGRGIGERQGNLPGPSGAGDKPANKEAENPFSDSEYKGRERKKSGLLIRLVDREPNIDRANKPIRSEIVGNEICIYKKHPDFENRLEKSRRGSPRITQRLITYLAGEITVHYKDKYHSREGQPEYHKTMFSGLVEFIYMFEDILSDLVGKNLSEFSE